MDAGAQTRRRLLNVSGWLLAAAIGLAAASRAWTKGMAGEPEWSYHRAAASTSFEGGLSVHNPGYLPGFSALMRPFFLLPEGFGLGLFIALSLVCSWFLLRLVWSECARLDARLPPRPGPWHWVWFSAPFYLAIQNNQVMTQMMLACVAGFLLLRGGRWVWGLGALSLSIAIKTFPITLGAYLLVRRRWRDAAFLGLAAAALTLLLGGLVYGLSDSLELHLAWPHKAGGQEPANLLRGHPPRFFSDNQSLAAWIVRAAPWIGTTPALVARYALLWGSLLATLAVYLRRGFRRELDWDEFALWMAWLVLAAPFGRYYYVVMLLPAWVRLAHVQWPARSSTFLRRLSCALPLLAWGTRTDGVYPLVCGLTFLLCLQLVRTREREQVASG